MLVKAIVAGTKWSPYLLVYDDYEVGAHALKRIY